jgi:hypothetical protein
MSWTIILTLVLFGLSYSRVMSLSVSYSRVMSLSVSYSRVMSLSVSYSRVMSQIVSFHLLFLFIWIINIGPILAADIILALF